MQLKASELLTIVAALNVAGSEYTANARRCEAYPRISEQFERQAKECNDLMARIENETEL